MSITKSFSIRTDEERIALYNKAINDLPIKFSNRKLIENYMDYIINSVDEYKKTNCLKIGFLSGDSNLVLLESENKESPDRFVVQAIKITGELDN